jgi:hypothetical protein
MIGWVMVGKDVWQHTKELVPWLDIGKSFALALPMKVKKKKSLMAAAFNAASFKAQLMRCLHSKPNNPPSRSST